MKKHLQKHLTKMLPTKGLLVVLMSLTSLLFTEKVDAQAIPVKGKIVDATGSGIPGVIVLIKGTASNGSVTDVDGNYVINVPDTGSFLTYNLLGFTSQEIKVGSKTSINVNLEEDVKNLREVVVTALGIEKEAKTTGYAIQTVAAEDLTKARDVNAINSLIGKVSGLSIGQSTEMRGAPQVILRGNTDLLYVVDGVPISSDSWNISNDDVDSYTILKGPNAAALYGSRALNGAIVITTKKGSGKKGVVSVDINSTYLYTSKSYLFLPEKQNQYGFGINYGYAFGNQPMNQDGLNKRPNVWGPKLDGELIPQFDSPVVGGIRQATPYLSLGPDNYKNFMETGALKTDNVAISATTDKANLRLSVSNTYQKGINPNTKINISNFNLAAGYQLSKKLRADGDVNFNYTNSPNVPDAMYGPNSYPYSILEYGSSQYDIRTFKNYWMVPGVQQYYAEYGRDNNPYFMAYEWLRPERKTDTYGYLKLSYDIAPGLTASARNSFTTWNVFRSEDLPVSAIIYGQALNLGEYREERRFLFENNADAMINYNKNITSFFNLSALAGASNRTMDYNSSWASTQYLVVPGVYSLNNSQTTIPSYSFKSGMSTTSGYYSADLTGGKYATLSTTGRLDKLSTLPDGKNTFFYPSVNLSTVLSDYVELPKAISFLKFFGSVANVKGALTLPTIGPAWQALGAVNPLSYGSAWMTPYNGPSYTNQNLYNLMSLYGTQQSAALSSTLANPNLKPYSVTSYEEGIQTKFLNNRIGLNITHFTSINGPQIFRATAAPSSGFDYQLVNGITTKKDGWEAMINLIPVKNVSGFTWDISGTWSTYREKLKSIYGDEKTVLINGHNFEVGDRLDAYYGYNYLRDNNGNIINQNGLPIQPPTGNDSKKLIGYVNNDYIWGIQNKVSYKDFTLSFSFDGRVGGIIYDEVYSNMMNGGNAVALVQGDFGAARQAEWEQVLANGTYSKGGGGTYVGKYVGEGVSVDPSGPQPKFDNKGNITNLDQLVLVKNATNVTLNSYVAYVQGFFDEGYVISRTYAKLRDVSLTYRLPEKLTSKTFMKKVSVSLVARNLLYFTAEKRKDLDLDQFAAGFNAQNIGRSLPAGVAGASGSSAGNNLAFNQSGGFQTPSARQFGFNVNITF